jgi:hypothetical protein
VVISEPQAVLMSEPQAVLISPPQAVLMSEPHAEAVTSEPQAVLMSLPQAVAITFCAILDTEKVSLSFHAFNLYIVLSPKFYIKVKKTFIKDTMYKPK